MAVKLVLNATPVYDRETFKVTAIRVSDEAPEFTVTLSDSAARELRDALNKAVK